MPAEAGSGEVSVLVAVRILIQCQLQAAMPGMETSFESADVGLGSTISVGSRIPVPPVHRRPVDSFDMVAHDLNLKLSGGTGIRAP